MVSGIIEEFIVALDEEIEAIKSGRGGSVVKVFNGRLLREVEALHVYVFNLENFLAVLDEAPAEIEINGNRYQAQVLLTQGLEVEIGIEHFSANYIPEAKLYTNSWYLLALLKNKYSEYLAGNLKADFRLSETIFTDNQSISTIPGEPQYTISKEVPNKSQKEAIQASFSSKLSIIWGPPGTGKTKTIAQAVEAHLNAGRRVLLVSHANNAVDEALERVASHMKPTSLYQEGKLVRLGKPQEEHLRRLESDYELVLMDKIAEKLGESLTAEKLDLDKEKSQLEEKLERFVIVNEALSNYKELDSEKQELLTALAKAERRLSDINTEIRQLETELGKSKATLAQAQSAGTFKRFFTGLDPKKIQHEIDEYVKEIDLTKRLENNLAPRLSELREASAEKEHQVAKAQNKVDSFLEELGFTEFEIAEKAKEYGERKDAILSRIAEINKQLEEIQKRVLSEAQLVATTLTKTFVSKQFPDTMFDVLILDEASMAPLPHIYWAAGRCKEMVTIVGDFLQLPPIFIAEKKEMARKWLGRSIFDVLGINEVDKAKRDGRVTMLNTQYRMNPAISEIPNRLFYQQNLIDHPTTAECILDDGVSKSPLVLIETSATNPWCSQLSTGGRFNLYNALVSATLAKRVAQNIPTGRVGVMTPYSAQARLINKIISDWQLLDKVRVSTVHKFQGGEEEAIIFDTCEAPVIKVAPMLDDQVDSNARLVLNVALTRAKSRLYLIGHTQHLLHYLHPDSCLARIIHHFVDNAEVLDSASLVDNYFTTDFEKWAEALLATSEAEKEPVSGEPYTEKNFWAQFLQDIKTVDERLVILSPFLTIRRTGLLVDYFSAMVGRGVDIRVFTRPRNQQTGEMANQADSVIDQLRNIGVKVTERARMHQKVAILDNHILWEGSLNILSHKDGIEQMRRFEGERCIEEVMKSLDLDEEMAVGNQTQERCPGSLRNPNCDGYLVIRSKYGRRFFGCSNYPKCDYTRPIDERKGGWKPRSNYKQGTKETSFRKRTGKQ